MGNEGKRIQECLLGFGLCNWVDGDAIYCNGATNQEAYLGEKIELF